MAFRTSTSRTNNAINVRDSRYVQGGTTDRFPNRLGWWERRELPLDDNDLSIVVRPSEDRRPDLVANRVYGKSTLQWLVLQYNTVVDIETEFRTGITLRLPDPRRVTLDIITRQTGGNRVTR